MKHFLCISLVTCLVVGERLYSEVKSNDTVPLSFSAPAVPAAGQSSEKNFKKKQKLMDEEAAKAAVAPFLASLDVYGDEELNEARIRKDFGPELDEWLKAGISGAEKAPDLQKKLASKIQKQYGLAFADWSIMQYIEPGQLALRVTLDVVREEDVSKRMNFKKSPQGKFKDPDGLLAKWQEYQTKALNLAQTDEFSKYPFKCKTAQHCLFGHEHPKLKPYESIFTKGVRKNKAQLIEILKQDENLEKRAAAAFLLPYIQDANELVALMVDRVRDPSALVRNNVMRVLGDIATGQPQIHIPLDPIVKALDYPLVTDRSKATYILHALSQVDHKKPEILATAFDELVNLLPSRQPSQSGLSYAILREISGQSYGPDNIKSWKKWYKRLPASKKKSTVQIDKSVPNK